MKGCGRVGWMLRSLGPEQKPLSHGGGAGSGKEAFAKQERKSLARGKLGGFGIKRSTSGQCSVFKEFCCNSGAKNNIAREYILISMTRHYMLISYCVVVLAACYCP